MLPGLRVVVSRVWAPKLMLLLNGDSPSGQKGSAAFHMCSRLGDFWEMRELRDENRRAIRHQR